jgi:hypothetical protein
MTGAPLREDQANRNADQSPKAGCWLRRRPAVAAGPRPSVLHEPEGDKRGDQGGSLPKYGVRAVMSAYGAFSDDRSYYSAAASEPWARGSDYSFAPSGASSSGRASMGAGGRLAVSGPPPYLLRVGW